MSAIKYWLWLSSQTEVSPRARAALVDYYGGAEEAFFAPTGDFACVPGLGRAEAARLEERRLDRVDGILAACREQGIEIVTMQDAAYPARLRNIFAPPVALYVKGSIRGIDDQVAVAVVGTRQASPYGLKMSRNLAYGLARDGAVVVSMLTAGIDQAAARGALLAGGRCIGVLGTAHPERENSLQRDIAAAGALVSEYPPGTVTQKSFFRDRNRLASGLSLGALVVEAPGKSGALLFAQEAMEQGRELFAVPGNADAENSVGTISLLKQGAKPVTCAWDVLDEFEPLYPRQLRHSGAELPPEPAGREAAKPLSISDESGTAGKKEIDKGESRGYIDLREQLSGLSEEQLNIISAIDSEHQHIDDIIEATGYSTAKVLAHLTVLEIKGFITRSAGKRICLNTSKK